MNIRVKNTLMGAGSTARRLFPALAALIPVCILAIIGCSRRDAAQQRLLLYCGAGLQEPVAELVAEFQQDRGVTVECDFQGSETLLNRIKLLRRGDLYLPGDVSYVRQAREEGLIEKSQDICYFVPVIIVSRDAPDPPKSLADLARAGMRVGLGDAEACAIGRTSAQLMAKNDISENEYEPNVVFRALTVNQLGDQVKLGHLDAAIVWDAVAAQFADSVDVVEIPVKQNVISRVSLGVLSCSQKPELADELLRYAASDRGREVFRKHGYRVSPPHQTPPGPSS
jgi:molybdate transport system substrate-binding protein